MERKPAVPIQPPPGPAPGKGKGESEVRGPTKAVPQPHTSRPAVAEPPAEPLDNPVERPKRDAAGSR